MLYALNVEYLDPVMIKGLPKKEDYKLLDNLVSNIVNNHKNKENKGCFII